MANLAAAKQKLIGDLTAQPPLPDFDLNDLPQNVTDPIWDQIERNYNLTLPELSALKNWKQRRWTELF
jgi:hypothetical protein